MAAPPQCSFVPTMRWQAEKDTQFRAFSQQKARLFHATKKCCRIFGVSRFHHALPFIALTSPFVVALLSIVSTNNDRHPT
jgi:hypothetical protein